MLADTVTVPGGRLEVDLDPGLVWRVGYPPNPLAWTPWHYAGPGGRFAGRWDDPMGEFRTVYAGQSLLGCLLEVLAGFRPDLALQEALAGVEEDSATPPTIRPRRGADCRGAGSAPG